MVRTLSATLSAGPWSSGVVIGDLHNPADVKSFLYFPLREYDIIADKLGYSSHG